ncbi:MAG: AAA-like domain-containing protein [Deltaproteobacteria bacterium]|nr:AAA-like domain-containing protein [Deltaproteobacteria bacterium]
MKESMPKTSIKVFNTVGPCIPSKHYMLPVLPRIPDVDEMINGEYYFIIHAPRQSGKTSYLKYLTNHINKNNDYYALLCPLESLDGIADRDYAINSIISQIHDALINSGIKIFKQLSEEYEPPLKLNSTSIVKNLLNFLCKNLDKELIVFFDEADCISEDPLITFLHQIRTGYINRYDSIDSKFPRSMALVGMRDFRDYVKKTRSNYESRILASPFNVKKDALTLSNFTQDEIGFLYHQHTEASGQVFDDESIQRAFYWTEGQPWLVNALAYETVVKILKNDYQKPVTKELIDEAGERLIKRRDTHIDSLLERLKDPRVAKVMDSVFASTVSNIPSNNDDRQYCIDLGLVVNNEKKELRVANNIYKEVFSRVITDQIQEKFNKILPETPWTDGKIIFMDKILKEFQKFWRKGSLSFPFHDSNYIASHYDEALYSFILFAFLQRLVNSKATVFWQLAEGRGAVDLGILYKDKEYIIEVKIKGNHTEKESISQLVGYLKSNNASDGWLVIFDRNREKDMDKKITWKKIKYEGKIIHIAGC